MSDLINVQTLPRRWYIYFIFTAAFGIFWFLFKLGGIPHPGQAISSTAIDVVFSLTALLLTVEMLIPALFYKGKYGLFLICLLSTILVTGTGNIFSQLYLMGSNIFEYQKNLTRYKEHFFYWFWSDLVMGSYFLMALIASGGLAIRLSFDRITTARQIIQLEHEKTKAELEGLKNQMNPHFLFNALNTVYYKIEKSNVEGRRYLESFSSLLRYQLYECNQPFVPVENEMKFLNDYISLQSERLDSQCSVLFNGFENIRGYLIAPFLCMPVVENCFKHISRKPENYPFIHIHVSLHGGWFEMQTDNSRDKINENGSGGIGLQNIRQRLEMIYPDNFIMEMTTEKNRFHLLLKIKLAQT
jgi:two-component system LytT family sensor kinase